MCKRVCVQHSAGRHNEHAKIYVGSIVLKRTCSQNLGHWPQKHPLLFKERPCWDITTDHECPFMCWQTVSVIRTHSSQTANYAKGSSAPGGALSRPMVAENGALRYRPAHCCHRSHSCLSATQRRRDFLNTAYMATSLSNASWMLPNLPSRRMRLNSFRALVASTSGMTSCIRCR